MIGNAQEIVKWLFDQERDKIFEIKEHREKRSLNANSYFWHLCGSIADVLRADKNDVYLIMLEKYGQSEMVSVRSEIDVTGYFKYFREIGHTKLQGKDFTHYKIFKGSSEYDTREMSILIDGAIFEAKNLNIETLTDHELQRIKEAWK